MKFAHKKYWLSMTLLGLVSTSMAQNHNPWDPYRQTLQEYYQEQEELTAQEERAAQNLLMACILATEPITWSNATTNYNHQTKTKMTNTAKFKTRSATSLKIVIKKLSNCYKPIN